MAKREQKQKPTSGGSTTAVEEAKPSSGSGDEIKAKLDELLDEIDEVLEENAEDFVRSYVQKGGQ
jgi:prokaryotic ubiquitin-like protein Pup